MVMPVFAKIITVTLLVCGFVGCGSHNKDRSPATVYEALLIKPEFSTFAALLNDSGLKDELLNSDARFTVFAPTNAALADISMEMRHAIMRDPTLEILKYHILRGVEIDSVGAMVSLGERRATEEGRELVLSMTENQLYVNTAKISGPAVEALNGVVHPIDELLLPPAAEGASTMNILDTLKSDDRFATFVSTLEETGLAPILADNSKTFTVFAPDENGFPYFPAEVLAVLAQSMSAEELEQFVLDKNKDTLQSYIVADQQMDSLTLYSLNEKAIQSVNSKASKVWIDDEGLKIGGALVIDSNIQVANGIIHVVGRPIVTLAE